MYLPPEAPFFFIILFFQICTFDFLMMPIDGPESRHTINPSLATYILSASRKNILMQERDCKKKDLLNYNYLPVTNGSHPFSCKADQTIFLNLARAINELRTVKLKLSLSSFQALQLEFKHSRSFQSSLSYVRALKLNFRSRRVQLKIKLLKLGFCFEAQSI